jgi:hypothetical protein
MADSIFPKISNRSTACSGDETPATEQRSKHFFKAANALSCNIRKRREPRMKIGITFPAHSVFLSGKPKTRRLKRKNEAASFLRLSYPEKS